jgi:hypothetical protein
MRLERLLHCYCSIKNENSVPTLFAPKRSTDEGRFISLRKGRSTSAYTNKYIYSIVNSVASYMFRPPAVAIFREVFLEGYITQTGDRIPVGVGGVGRDFPRPSRPALEPTQPPVHVQWVPGIRGPASPPTPI